jgi:hypothetical protein
MCRKSMILALLFLPGAPATQPEPASWEKWSSILLPAKLK